MWAIMALAAAMQAAGPNMAPNGGMEGDYVAGTAPGWEANCYGDYQVRFEKETTDPHSGAAAQKIICTRFERGGIQIRCRGISVKEGKVYTLQAWLRGEGISGPVLLCIRQHGKPYTRYLSQCVKVSRRWRRFTVIGPAKATDPDCGIYIWFAGTGTLWIDDVSLRPGAHKPTTPSVEQPPVKGNRVYNSSFELGAAGWVGGQVASSGWEGRYSLAIRGGQTAESRPFVVTAGQLYTVSLYARGSGTLRVEIAEYADRGGDRPEPRHHEVAEFRLGRGWRRYSFRAVLEAPFTRGYMLRLSASQGNALVDAVQVEEGDLTAYAPARPVELALEVPVLKRYPLPRQPVEATVRVWHRYGAGPVEVELTWEDLLGKRQRAGRAIVNLAKGFSGAAKVRCPGRDFGIYRLIASAGESCIPGEVVVGVLPADDGQRKPGSFFGTHAQMDPRSDNIAVVLARRAGMRWYRLHDFNHHVQWIACEPQRHGEYRWADQEILDLYRRGFCLLGTLVRTPKWAGRDYPPDRPAIVQARVPRRLEWFADFTRAVVKRYRGVVGHWEMWNEPYGRGFWAGTPEEYVELERLGYQAAKQANGSCRVVGMCVYTGAREWIRRAVAAGGLEWLDILSFHVYISPQLVDVGDDGRSRLEKMVLYLRSLLRDAGREDVAIWDTEGGVPCASFYSWLPPDGWRVLPADAAATVTKACVQLMGQGVEKWFYYFIGYARGGPGRYYTMNNIPYVQLDTDGSPKATLLAHAAAARLLDERPFVGRAVADRWVAYVFDDHGRAVAVAWARRASRDGAGGHVQLQIPERLGAVEVLDVMGRPRGKARSVMLTGLPVYLRNRQSGYRVLAELRRLAKRRGQRR